MRILLTTLNSKYVHSNLALKYLYTVVCEEYSDVDVREFTINLDQNYVYCELMKANYDIVCFSTYIWNVEEIKRISKDLKLANPDIKIVLGGPEVTYRGPEFVKENPWVDFVIGGEGEYPFYRFIEVLHSPGKDYNTVPGLIYRQNGLIYVNPMDEPLDMNIIPFPYNILDVEKDRVVYYESSRGCPFRCSYCLSSIDKTVRNLKLERVKIELKYFLHKNVKQVKFVDRTFNYDRERSYEIVKFLIDNDNGITSFHLEICADLIDENLFDLFGRARKGQFELEIGIQSTNPETLRAINRGENCDKVLKNTRRLVELGNVHVHVDLIAGLPYESYDIFKNSFNDVYGLGADQFQLGFLKVLKGTPISYQLERYGIKYREYAPYEVISTDFISSYELVKLQHIENMVDVYYNRGGFSKSISYLISVFNDNPFEMYEALADFYYSNGYQNRSHSKDDNYRILYSFISNFKEENIFLKGFLLLDEDAKDTMDELNYKRFISKKIK